MIAFESNMMSKVDIKSVQLAVTFEIFSPHFTIMMQIRNMTVSSLPAVEKFSAIILSKEKSLEGAL